MIDGSDSIRNDLKKNWFFHSFHKNGNKIFYADLEVEAWQLFVDGKEQVPARWPNAKFDDFSVFHL